MVCNCCSLVIRERLEKSGLVVNEIKLGELTVEFKNKDTEKIVIETLHSLGLELIMNRDILLVEKIKLAVIDLVHQLNNVNSIIRKSDYLVDKLGMSYQVLSKTFSQHEPVTLEKYIILQKIEKIKELIDTGEYTHSEIAYMMDYSSVQHLSAQFKNITGFTPSEYKNSDHSIRKSIDRVSD